eukprot:6179161-Pleurochrysis_carterae.AAC.3
MEGAAGGFRLQQASARLSGRPLPVTCLRRWNLLEHTCSTLTTTSSWQRPLILRTTGSSLGALQAHALAHPAIAQLVKDACYRSFLQTS